MELPPRTFRSLQKLRLIWWCDGESEEQARDADLLHTFTSHMLRARKHAVAALGRAHALLKLRQLEAVCHVVQRQKMVRATWHRAQLTVPWQVGAHGLHVLLHVAQGRSHARDLCLPRLHTAAFLAARQWNREYVTHTIALWTAQFPRGVHGNYAPCRVAAVCRRDREG